MSALNLLQSAGLEDVATGGLVCLIIVMTLVQIAPIKIDPWSKLAKSIGRSFNGEVLDRLDTLENEMKEHKMQEDEEKADAKRRMILAFGDELLRGTRHSHERFKQVLSDITAYENYCNSHENYMNEQANLTIQNIKAMYQKCWQEQSFL